jgi:putative transposase
MPRRPIVLGTQYATPCQREPYSIRNSADSGAAVVIVTTARMPRLARAVVPGLPLHVTQRGNRRQRTFFRDDDYLLYCALMREWCDRYGVEIWAYCLMQNHVHLIAVPDSPDGLRRAVAEAHRRYTTEVNRREGWTGCLWQGRFSSFVMDDRHLLIAARYVELNPVRAGLVSRAQDYWWSSARAHLFGLDDGLVTAAPLLARVDDWSAFLGESVSPEAAEQLHRHERTGRPLGDDDFVARLETLLNRVLRPRKPGPIARCATDSAVEPPGGRLALRAGRKLA